MRMTTVFAALRVWVKRLWRGARTPTSSGSLGVSGPLSEPLSSTREDENSATAVPVGEEFFGDRGGLSDDPCAGEPRDDEPRPIEPATDPDKLGNNSVPAGYEPPVSDSEFGDRLSPTSAEAEPDGSSPAPPPTDDDGQGSAHGTGERPENGDPGGIAESDTRTESSRSTTRKPRRISGRRGRPRENPEPEPRQPPSFRPELVCRRAPASAIWEILLYADDRSSVAEVLIDGTAQDFADRRCRIPSLMSRLTVSSQDGREITVPLFEGEPLIFKLRKGWTGEGRRIARITGGHFIVIAPDEWERTGRAPVEPDGCAASGFRAHYFHRDAAEPVGIPDGFRDLGQLPERHRRRADRATHIRRLGRRIAVRWRSARSQAFIGDWMGAGRRGDGTGLGTELPARQAVRSRKFWMEGKAASFSGFTTRTCACSTAWRSVIPAT